jgi:hypothetical protein
MQFTTDDRGRGMFLQHDFGIFTDANWRHHDLCGGYI